MTLLFLVVFIAISIALAVLAYRFWKQNADTTARFAGILDVEREKAKAEAELQELQKKQKDAISQDEARKRQVAEECERLKQTAETSQQEFLREDVQRRKKLDEDYQAGLEKLELLKSEVNLLEENLEDISFGVYKPHFTFATSEDYKTALGGLRDREKEMIRNREAATCPLSWSVGGSAKDGERMVKQYTKVMLRAFNAECDAALANVSWNNVTKMEERVQKAFGAINELGGVMQVSITKSYLRLKLDEIRMTFELENKKQEEKEEQRKFKERLRDEEKAQREIQKAQEESEEQEAVYEKALAKAREETMKATGEQLQALTEQVKTFEAKLDEARRKKEKAIARAQLTSSGVVYVISNIGAFGEKVFKIGMTRRLEPLDRIAELSDASVPFPFDVHAMLYAHDAPELEAALHSHLEERRVNLVNRRKEFYSEVELTEIEAFVKERGLSAEFFKTPEAREYRETMALRSQKAGVASATPPNDKALSATA